MRVADATTLGPIQLIPQGLTGLLQIKQLGRVPGELSEVVSPVVELRDWYFTSRTVTEQDLFGGVPFVTIATGSIGYHNFATISAQVPNNQRWYVFNATVLTQKQLAGDQVVFGIATVAASSGSPVLLSPLASDLGTARVTNPIVNAVNFWVGPGDSFGVWIDDVLSTGLQFQLRLRAVSLPI